MTIEEKKANNAEKRVAKKAKSVKKPSRLSKCRKANKQLRL